MTPPRLTYLWLLLSVSATLIPIDVPFFLSVPSVIAQTVEDRILEADRLLEQGNQQYNSGQFQEALQFWEKALRIYQEIKNRQGEANSLYNFGLAYASLGNHQKAIEYYQQSLVINQEINNRQGEANSLYNLGLAYTSLGDHQKAIEYYQQSLAIDREINNRQGEANSLINLGNSHYSLGNYQKAIEYYQQSLAIDREINNRQGEANSLYNLGLAYTSLGDYQKAIEYYQQSVVISREISDSLRETSSLNNLGNIYNSLGQYQLAIEYLQQSLVISRETSERSGEALSLYNLGNSYYYLGQYQQSIKHYQQSLAINQEIKNHLEEANSWTGLGNCYNMLGQYQQAIEYLQQSLAIHREIKNRLGEAYSLGSLGYAYSSLGQFQQAIKYLQQSVTISQELGDHISEASSLNNLGYAYYSLGQYQQAIKYYQQSLAINQENKNRWGEAYCLTKLGEVHEALGQSQKAIEYHQQSLTIFTEIGNDQGKVYSLVGLGNANYLLSQYQQAIEYYQQSLAISKEIGDRFNEATSIVGLGNTYDSLGQSQKAIEYLQQSLIIKREIGDRQGEGIILVNMGLIYSALEEYQQAIEYYQQSLTITKETGDRETEGFILDNLGFLFTQQNQPELAIIFYKQSVNVREAIRKDLKGLSQELQQSYIETIANSYRNLADLLLQQNRIIEAQRVLDLLKVQEINDYIRGTRSNENTSQGIPLASKEQQVWISYQELINKAVTLGKELSELRKIKPQDRTSAQQQRVLELKKAETSLIENFNNFINSPEVLATIKNLNPGTKDDDLADELGKLSKLSGKLEQLNAVLLYPLILEDRIELIITTPYSPPIHRTVQVSQKELNQAILKFRESLQNPNSDPKPFANQFYQWLIQPLEEDLKTANVKTIIYAPDGQLRYIPLAALYDGKQWLIERYRINHITAMSLSDFDDQPQTEIQIFAGAFTQGQYNFQIGQETFNFSGLPYAGKEVTALGEMIPDTVKLLDNAFSKEQTQVMMEGSTIIHLATHAAIVVGQPEKSFILFGNGDRATLDEVENWKFNEVDLIVLSACETGLGGNLGDGKEILGFGYLMQNAGAKASIASLWSVSDGGTQALMSAFYISLQRSETSKSEALQKAQIALITGDYEALGEKRGIEVRERISRDVPTNISRQLTHPYYWAPFILIGNGL